LGLTATGELGESDLAKFFDTKRLVIMTVKIAGTDAVVFLNAQGQTITVPISENDAIEATESAGLTINVEGGENDLSTFMDTGHVQIILAALGKTDLATFMESQGQSILVPIIEQDTMTFLESLGLTALAKTGGVVGLISNETGKLQVVTVQAGNDVYKKYIEALGQALSIPQGALDSQSMKEQRLALLLAKMGEVDLYWKFGGGAAFMIIGGRYNSVRGKVYGSCYRANSYHGFHGT